MKGKKEEEVIYTDRNFLEEMRQIEREVLAEIDPEALQRFEKEEKGTDKIRK